MSNIREVMGKNLRHFRKLRGLTQAELATLVDVSGSYVGYLERGKQSPSLNLLEKISNTLGITPIILLTSPADTKNSDLNSLIAFLSDKSPNMIKFIYEVANAYYRSLGKGS